MTAFALAGPVSAACRTGCATTSTATASPAATRLTEPADGYDCHNGRQEPQAQHDRSSTPHDCPACHLDSNRPLKTGETVTARTELPPLPVFFPAAGAATASTVSDTFTVRKAGDPPGPFTLTLRMLSTVVITS